MPRMWTVLMMCDCRELLRLGAEVVMVGNTLPAINDITVTELTAAVEDVSRFCPTIKANIPQSESASLFIVSFIFILNVC